MDDPSSLPRMQTLSPEKETLSSTGGMKYDGGKPELSLIPTSLIMEVGKVLTYGANKYAPNNWRKGIYQTRLISASLRHIVAYMDGEILDKESGLPHLAHAICELSFAMEQQLKRRQYSKFLNMTRKGEKECP